MTAQDAFAAASSAVGQVLRTPAREADWHRGYSRRLLLTDTAVLVVVVFVAQWIWTGAAGPAATVSSAYHGSTWFDVSYTLISLFLVVVWCGALAVRGTRAPRLIGTGADEYRRVLGASFTIFGIIAIAVFVLNLDLGRGYVLIAFPVGTIGLLLSRWLWRQWLVARRAQGRYGSRMLLVGSAQSAAEIARSLERAGAAGYFVVGACVPASYGSEYLPNSEVPVIGTLDDPFAALEAVGADTICVTGSSALSPAKLRRLSWQLEPGRHHLVVVPGLTDVSGPRLHTRPVAGLPLMHVETPRYDGGKLVAKRTFDLVASALAIALLSPVILAITLAVRFGSAGPVFFRQQRIGRNGEAFTMLKFRSMVVDAEARLIELTERERAEGNVVMFKMRDDPRVTRVGRTLRRYSLDELPQLFNVFSGSMSLVGPRPPLLNEVEQYEEDVHRRFLVKPGITGLWQVSGRSDLSWEETVRLDLFYVENWSLTSDLVLLWRTGRAVLARDGAY